jgi:hypothetical protein
MIGNVGLQLEKNNSFFINVDCGKQKNGRRDSIFSTTATRFTTGKG